MTSKRPSKSKQRTTNDAAPSGSLTEVAYQAIKTAILNNQLHAGDALPADRFVQELALSRTPVREALLRLEKEGLVEVRPRMGTFVTQLNLREIQESYQVRQELEGLAARLAARRADAAQLAAVERALKKYPLRGEIDCQGMSEAGQQLHALVVEACGNLVLARMIRSLQDHFTRFRALSLDIPEKVRDSHREHLAILAALKAGDGALAEQLMQEHFAHAGRALVERLLNQNGLGPSLAVTVQAAHAPARWR